MFQLKIQTYIAIIVVMAIEEGKLNINVIN